MFGSFLGPVLDFATSAWSSNEAEKNADTQAWVARNYQAGREDTAYQRTVADLNKAGLSPMLAYSKGAHISSASPVAGGSQQIKSDFTGASERSQQSSLAKAQADAAKSQETLNMSNAAKAVAETDNINQDTQNKKLYPGLSAAQIEQLKGAATQSGASAKQLEALMDEIRQKIAIEKPKERFATEEPEKAKWISPLTTALNEIFKGIGALRGNSATINTTTTYPDGSKSKKTTTRSR
jgi:hypothetical protein